MQTKSKILSNGIVWSRRVLSPTVEPMLLGGEAEIPFAEHGLSPVSLCCLGLILLVGCGSSSQPTPTTTPTNPISSTDAPFVGSWVGQSALTVGGHAGTFQETLLIIPDTNDTLNVQLCENDPQPVATVTSTTTFTIASYDCGAQNLGSCPSTDVAGAGGAGTITGTTLSLSTNGTAVGCSPEAFTFNFTGSLP